MYITAKQAHGGGSNSNNKQASQNLPQQNNTHKKNSPSYIAWSLNTVKPCASVGEEVIAGISKHTKPWKEKRWDGRMRGWSDKEQARGSLKWSCCLLIHHNIIHQHTIIIHRGHIFLLLNLFFTLYLSNRRRRALATRKPPVCVESVLMHCVRAVRFVCWCGCNIPPWRDV